MNKLKPKRAREGFYAMAPRRRANRVGLKRIDTAIDALRPLGFSKKVVCNHGNALLKVYDGNEGWVFIEECSYMLLIEVILEEQEKAEDETFESGNEEDESTFESGNEEDESIEPFESRNEEEPFECGNEEDESTEPFESEHEEDESTEPFSVESENEITGVGETSTGPGVMGPMTETGLQENVSSRDAHSAGHGFRLEWIDRDSETASSHMQPNATSAIVAIVGAVVMMRMKS